MRILTVIDNLGPGGRQRTAQNYVLGFAEVGHECGALALQGGGPRADNLRRSNVPVWEPSTGDRHLRKAAHWNPDVIHLHSEGPPQRLIGERVEDLLSLLPHPVPVIETSSFGKVDYRQRFSFTTIHLLKARWALWRWQKWSRPFRPRPVGAVVPNSIDVQSFRPQPETIRNAFRGRLELPEGAFLAGRIGQPIIWKWSPVALEAFRDFASGNLDAHLLLVGLPPELRQLVDAFPSDVRRRVHEIPFLDSDEELAAAYAGMDCFLHSSRIGESFGMVLGEALACKVPIITQSRPARDNSQVELVGHDRGGMVVHQRRGMVEALDRLYQSQQLRDRYGTDGHHHVRTTYSPGVVMSKLDRVLHHVQRATSREDLRNRVGQDDALVTEVSDSEIGELMHASLDAPPLSQRILKWAVHEPVIYRPWRAIKFRNY